MKIEKIEKIRIDDLYNILEEDSSNVSTNKDYVINPFLDLDILSVSSDFKKEIKSIPYIMKHKVNKRMFKINTTNDSITVTKDHSIMCKRNNELLAMTPENIKSTDELIIYTDDLEYIDNFEIIDLGIQKEWVYDIEVEDNHNFFGNNILVHNSVYFSIEPFVDRAFKTRPDATIEQKVDFCDNFYNKIIEEVVQKSINDFGTELNAFNPSVIGCDREVIADCIHPRSQIKIKQNDKTETISISKLARRYDIKTTNKYQDIVDISNDDIFISSYNNGKEELNKILNIQQKVTTKEMYKLILPNGKSITCTEDHLIGVEVNGELTFKPVVDITENDDVIIQ